MSSFFDLIMWKKFVFILAVAADLEQTGLLPNLGTPRARRYLTGRQRSERPQAGLTQGINFAVAKVQKSPADTEAINEVKQKELKEMFTQCQTRIIQI